MAKGRVYPETGKQYAEAARSYLGDLNELGAAGSAQSQLGGSIGANQAKPQGLCEGLKLSVILAGDAMAKMEGIEARLHGSAGSSASKDTTGAAPEPALTLSDRLSAMLVEINKRLQVISQSL